MRDAAGDVTAAQERIRVLASAFQESRVLLTAVELGVFDLLAAGPLTSSQVAARVAADPRAVDRLLNALCAIGLLGKTADRFSLAPAAACCLVKGAAGYMGNLQHVAHMWDSWTTLTASVRKGGAADSRPPGAVPEAGRPAFIAAMQHGALRQADDVVAGIDLSGVASLLDVGAGSGGWAMAFLRRSPALRATLFDLPEILPLTRGYVADALFAARVAFVAGDYNRDRLPAGFDLVFMSSIVHINPPDQNAALIRKGAAALNPGGRLIVRDFVVEDDRTGPRHAVLFALNMLVNTEAGDTYSESEIRGWMTAARLEYLGRTRFPGSADLLAGRKPG